MSKRASANESTCAEEEAKEGEEEEEEEEDRVEFAAAVATVKDFAVLIPLTLVRVCVGVALVFAMRQGHFARGRGDGARASVENAESDIEEKKKSD